MYLHPIVFMVEYHKNIILFEYNGIELNNWVNLLWIYNTFSSPVTDGGTYEEIN
jgi:hypothetical protein